LEHSSPETMGTKSDDDVRFGGVMSEAEILLVEDDSNCEELALRALKRAGYLNVAVARDGLEALGMLSGEGGDGGGRKPEAVLLDMRLPKLGGIAVLQRLRSDVRPQGLRPLRIGGPGRDRAVSEPGGAGCAPQASRRRDPEDPSFLSAISTASGPSPRPR
jgi:two-component system, response regulator